MLSEKPPAHRNKIDLHDAAQIRIARDGSRLPQTN